MTAMESAEVAQSSTNSPESQRVSAVSHQTLEEAIAPLPKQTVVSPCESIPSSPNSVYVIGGRRADERKGTRVSIGGTKFEQLVSLETPTSMAKPSIPASTKTTTHTTATTSPRNLLPDAAEMKKKVRANMMKRQYDVHDFYKKTGCSQEIARSQRFESLTLLMIVFNAIYMWIDCDYNSSPTLHGADISFQIAENFFAFFFVVEISIRFSAFQYKRNCLRDGWFVFDSFLVASSVFETWILGYCLLLFGSSGSNALTGNSGILRLFRLLRLSRMSRMARILHSVPELMILIKGMAAASSSCIFTALLLIIAMYVWALALKQMGSGADFAKKYFPDIPGGMYTLMMSGCFFKEFEVVMDTLKRESVLCFLLFFSFVLFAGVAIMKMLTGMLCKVINAVGASETEKLMVAFVKEELLKSIIALGCCDEKNAHDVDTDALEIAHSTFCQMLNDDRALEAFRKIGVDPVGLVSSIDFIFPVQNKLTPPLPFTDFMDAILNLRSSNTATVKDFVEIRKFVRAEVQEVGDYFRKLMGKVGKKSSERRPSLTTESLEELSQKQDANLQIADDTDNNDHKRQFTSCSRHSTASVSQAESTRTSVVSYALTADDVFRQLCELSEADKMQFFAMLAGVSEVKGLS